MLKQDDKKKKIIKYLLLIGIVVGVIIYFRDSIDDIMEEVKKTSIRELLMITILSGLYFVIEGTIISFMTKKYVRGIGKRQGIGCAYFCSFYRVVTFGGGSGIAEAYYLSRRGVDAAKAVGMSLVQYIIQKTAIAVYGVFGYFCWYSQMKGVVKDYGTAVLLGFFGVGLIVAVLILISVSVRFSDLVFQLLDKINWKNKKWKGKIEKMKNQVAILQCETKELLSEKKKLGKIFILNLIKLTSWYMIPYVVLKEDTELSAGFAVALMAVIVVLAGVLPAPSGFGSMDFVFILLYGEITGCLLYTSRCV